MRFPALPPDDPAALRSVLDDPHKQSRLQEILRSVDCKGRYLHWDELRRRTPPEGFTAEEWWAGVRLSRNLIRQNLPLRDVSGAAFGFSEPPPLRAMLRNLDVNAGGVLQAPASGLSVAEGRAHLSGSLAEEPFASSLLEGAATTRQIAKQMIFEGRPPRTVDERMVLNNHKAMEYVRDQKGEALSLDLLLELHRVVTAGTLEREVDAGRLRGNDEVRVVDDSTGEILFQPPAHHLLPDRLQRLIAFTNTAGEADDWMHPLLKAFTLHFMLAYEHPFVDGNGRLARALFYWQALRSGYWLLEYVSISTVIRRAALRYGQSYLFVETDNADLTYFLFDQARTLQTAIASLQAFVTRRKSEVDELERRLARLHLTGTLNHRQLALLNGFVRDADLVATIEGHQTRHGVSYLTARADLERLTAAGLALKRKRGVTSIYTAAADLHARLRR